MMEPNQMCDAIFGLDLIYLIGGLRTKMYQTLTVPSDYRCMSAMHTVAW